MDQASPSTSTGGNDGQGNEPTESGNRPAKAAKEVPTVDGAESVSASASAEQPTAHGKDKQRAKGQTLYEWLVWPFGLLVQLLDSKRFRRLVTLAAAVALVIVAWRQNTLISEANKTATASRDIAKLALDEAKSGGQTANEIAKVLRDTAKATEGTADATLNVVDATKAIAQQNAKTVAATLAVAQESVKTAKATKDVATENAKTASATKDIATENAKTARATEQVAATAERALRISNSASLSAARAAQAAEEATNMAKASLTLAAKTSIYELRSYLTIIGTDLRYDPVGRRVVAAITIQTSERPQHTKSNLLGK